MLDLTHLHPMVVHFPVALILVALLFDVVSLFTQRELFGKMALYLLVLGTLGLIAAFLTGDLAEEGVEKTRALHQVLETHEEAGELTMWFMIVVVAARLAMVYFRRSQGVFQWAALAAMIIGALLVIRTAYYGGELVYKHGAGVQIAAPTATESSNPAPPSLQDDDEDEHNE